MSKKTNALGPQKAALVPCSTFAAGDLRRWKEITMINILKEKNGMNIIGQGGKIILFMLPSLIAAIWFHTNESQIAALPESISFIKPVGYLLLLLGLILWGAAIIQLLLGFPKGKLVTTGAYGIVRNPIYSSATFFILPAVALMNGSIVLFRSSCILALWFSLAKRRNNLRRSLAKNMKII